MMLRCMLGVGTCIVWHCTLGIDGCVVCHIRCRCMYSMLLYVVCGCMCCDVHCVCAYMHLLCMLVCICYYAWTVMVMVMHVW